MVFWWFSVFLAQRQRNPFWSYPSFRGAEWRGWCREMTLLSVELHLICKAVLLPAVPSSQRTLLWHCLCLWVGFQAVIQTVSQGLTQNCFIVDGNTHSKRQMCSALPFFLLFEAVLKSHLLWKTRVGLLGAWGQWSGAPAPKAATRVVTQKLSLSVFLHLSHISTPMENSWVPSSHDLSFAASRQPVAVSGLAWSFIQLTPSRSVLYTSC